MRAIKGQDVDVSVMVDGVLQDQLKYAKSLNVNVATTIIEEQYLGETTNRFDTVFNGVGGDIEYQYANKKVFTFISAVIEKARARTPGAAFHIRCTLNFPDGGRQRVVFRDVSFGEMPLGFSGRAERGSFKISWKCSEWQLLPS